MTPEEEVQRNVPIIVQSRIKALYMLCVVDRGNTVVKLLCYKSEGRWFDPSWCHWIFSFT